MDRTAGQGILGASASRGREDRGNRPLRYLVDTSVMYALRFRFDADIGEVNNLAESQTNVVKELQALAASYGAQLKAQVRPVWRAENTSP